METTLKHRFALPVPFDEFRVWAQQMRPTIVAGGVEAACLGVLEYVCTELLNNIVDHSGATSAEVGFDWNPGAVALSIEDDGRGIFEVVRSAHGLGSLEDAALLLLKGKVTSDPQRHTGEGLFFSARACEWFCIQSSSLGLALDESSGWMFATPNEKVTGTRIRARVSRRNVPDMKRLFDEFCPQPDLRFTRTVVQVGLLRRTDGDLVSRSQGKRLVLGLDKFSSVTFDFAGVQDMQQGFADEVFRVWRNAHPQIGVEVIHTSDGVERMLKHVGFTADSKKP